MALTNGVNATILTNAQAAVAMRLHGDPDVAVAEPLNGIIERLLNTCDAIVTGRTVDTLPQSVRLDCVLTLAAFMYDAPITGRSNAWIRSGAFDLCRKWLRRRGGVMDRE